jgi:hypothetical protein
MRSDDEALEWERAFDIAQLNREIGADWSIEAIQVAVDADGFPFGGGFWEIAGRGIAQFLLSELKKKR